MAGLFGGLRRFASNLNAPAQDGLSTVDRIGLFGGALQGQVTPMQISALRRAGLAARDQQFMEDRLRAQLSPADGPMGSGTGAAPTIEQQMAALDEARLLNPAVAEQFAPIVQQRRTQQQAAALFRDDPRAQALWESGNETFRNSLGEQYKPQVIGAGGVQSVIGEGRTVAAPSFSTVNDTIYRNDPTTGRSEITATAPPGYDDQTARINANTVNVAPRNQVFRDGQLYVQNTQPTPLSDADQRAIADAEARVAALDTSLTRAAEIDRQIEAGELNLNPIENMISAGRNAAGLSSQNSLNYDALLAWAREARNAILQANTGVQTDQDAVRELETILSGVRDERIVRAALGRFQEARRATRDVFQRDIQRRSGQGQPQAQPQQQGGQVSREAAIAELRRRGLL